MENITYQQMDEAVKQAENLIRRAENYKTRMAKFLIGRLRGIDRYALSDLKKELKDFNSVTGEWK